MDGDSRGDADREDHQREADRSKVFDAYAERKVPSTILRE